MKTVKFRNMGFSDKIFYVINTFILLFSFIMVLVPLLYVLAQSFSDAGEVLRGKVFIIPKGFNVNAYKQVAQSKLLVSGFRNAVIYTVCGTLVNVVMTVMAAYPLSRKDFVGRNVFTALFMFTMIFAAPLIPAYLNIRNFGMLDSIWAMIIPKAISVYNMIIARTFFQSNIPDEMIEAAEIDGASDIQILMRFVLPLSKAVLAVLTLFYAVEHWNSYFNAMIYLNSESKFPLQLVLRNILSNAKTLEELANTVGNQATQLASTNVLKYAVIVVGSIPMLVLYPFVQKYFIKGVMIGSVKG